MQLLATKDSKLAIELPSVDRCQNLVTETVATTLAVFVPKIIPVSTAAPLADRVIHILAIEADPVMQSGLVTCINRFSDLQLAAESTPADALKVLTDRTFTVDLLLLGLPLDLGTGMAQLDWVGQVRAIVPNLPILLLASPQERDLMAAFQLGITGCCAKGSSILDLVNCIRQVAAGQTAWAPEMLQQLTLPQQGRSGLGATLRATGLRQIETALIELDRELRQERLSAIDRRILAGRRRELNTARWLLKRLLPSPVSSSPPPQFATPTPQPLPRTSSQIVVATSTEIASNTDRAGIFDRIAAKLPASLENLTPTPLEIDILRSDKKLELFYLILRQFEDLLAELRFSQVSIDQLPAKQHAIWQDLWASVTTDFFGRYHTAEIAQLQIELVPTLLQDAPIVSAEILDRIPQPIDLLNYLLFQQPLTIDNMVCQAGTVAAEQRAVTLLENLTICMATAVMQPLLNHFADIESMKTGYYDRRLLSNREIERFRNDLSWRYRLERYIGEPQDIFESRYRLFVFTNYGIKRAAIYAPRPEELARLNGIPLVVTLALETRDAIAPRLRSATTFLGSGIVYLLTEIIGRGIGLIGRGVIKGVGNIWQQSSRRE